MHCAVEDNSGGEGEFLIRGRAVEVSDTKMREEAFDSAKRNGYDPQERYVLFELMIEEATVTLYDEGPPRRTKWKADNRY